MSYTWRNQLEYARNFKEEHFVTAVVGQEMSDSKSRSFDITPRNTILCTD